jgi:8-oxo-dGTP pyrophosphatase MutT (NUDIX family)
LLWNGRVLLLHDYAILGAAFRGDFLETDFESFIAWRDWGTPDVTAKDCFAMGAIRGSDGAFVLGVMGGHTANEGKIYFPAGMVDGQDLNGTSIDLESSMWREVEEETGLTRDALKADSFWHTVFEGPSIAHIRILQACETSHALRALILANLRRQKHPELIDIHIVREAIDRHPMMHPVVVAFLKSVGIL